MKPWLVSFWPVIFFALLSLSLFENGQIKIQADLVKLSEQKKYLQKQILHEINIRECLRNKINSESDPSWIELVLMHKLGLVAENQTKIVFNPI